MVGGDSLCNTYLLHVNHHGTWQGDILIGTGQQIWTTPIMNEKYKGTVEAGCKELQSPYNCHSKEELQ